MLRRRLCSAALALGLAGAGCSSSGSIVGDGGIAFDPGVGPPEPPSGSRAAADAASGSVERAAVLPGDAGASPGDAAGPGDAGSACPGAEPRRGVPYELQPCSDVTLWKPGPIVVGDRLAFGGISYAVPGYPHYIDLFLSDGTTAGTRPLGGAYDHNNTYLAELVANGLDIYFLGGTNNTDSWGVWVTDGTAPNTGEVYPGGSKWRGPTNLVELDGAVFWTDNSMGGRLLRADHREVSLVAAFNPTQPDTYVFERWSSLTASNGVLYFAGTKGAQLWRSDGTAAGTAMVADLAPGAAVDTVRAPSLLHDHHGLLFFAADDGGGTGLWRSDGTAAGTALVRRLPAIAELVTLGTTLVFVADDGVHGKQLWATDGTAAGTAMVALINAAGSAEPTGLTSLLGRLFFTADDGLHGAELWRSDGTAAGTALVADVNPGPAGSRAQAATAAWAQLAALGGLVYFTADDGAHGKELWRTDGTAAATTLVADLEPGTVGSRPSSLVAFGGALFFGAGDPQQRLFRLDP